MVKLLDILKETIIVEGRKEDVMIKYPGNDDMVEFLSKNDPSGNNKYLEWVVNQYVNGSSFPNSLEDVVNDLNSYHNNLSKINKKSIDLFLDSSESKILSKKEVEKINKAPKDINIFESYTTFKLFVDFIKNIESERKKIKEIKTEGDRVYEDEDILVVSPRTHRSSCHYGKHSKWCVATSGSGHFKNYTQDGVLYFFLSRKNVPITPYWADATDTQEANEPPFKTALLIKDNGHISWWSKADINYSNGWVGDSKLPFLTQTMADKITEHNTITIKNRVKLKFLDTLNVSGYYKLKSSENTVKEDFKNFLLKDNYDLKQILSIINNDNYLIFYEKSDVGDKVRSSYLTSNQIKELTINAIKSNNGSNEILSEMSSNEFFTYINKNLTDLDNKEILETIKLFRDLTSLKESEIGVDAKLFLEKYSLSPKDWEKYLNTSVYIFVGSVDSIDYDGENVNVVEFDELINIDRFNVVDRRKIPILGITAKTMGKTPYGLMTSKGKYDKYIGMSSEDIPMNVLIEISKDAMKSVKK
jgi:hypothetical protein